MRRRAKFLYAIPAAIAFFALLRFIITPSNALYFFIVGSILLLCGAYILGGATF